MRIQLLDYDVDNNSIYVDNINHIISYNGGGKTKLCDLLYEGFEGKLTKKILVDGEIVNKTKYDVYYIKDIDTLDVEKALSAKTIIRRKIKEILLDLEEVNISAINEDINKLKDNLYNRVISKIDEDSIKLDLDINYEELITKFSNIKVNENSIDSMSYTAKRLAYIDLVINQINLSVKDTILIIDEFNIGLSLHNQKLVLKKLKGLKRCKVFISSSSIIDVKNTIYVRVNKVTNNIINRNEVIEVIAFKEKCKVDDVIELYSDQEIDDFITYNNILETVLTKFLES